MMNHFRFDLFRKFRVPINQTSIFVPWGKLRAGTTYWWNIRANRALLHSPTSSSFFTTGERFHKNLTGFLWAIFNSDLYNVI